MRKARKIPPAYSGTTTRMKVLPHVNISSSDNFCKTPQEMISNDESRRLSLIHEDAAREPLIRKCVYNYEDKYSFARITVLIIAIK